MIDAGQTAPDFTLPRDGSEEVTLSGLRGSTVVLYFYPKDDTSGCTKEALAFSEHRSQFETAGATVLGVSRDSVVDHNRFRDKHGLSVILLADEDGRVCESYGVWGEKSMYGKTYMGIDRSTFLIDGDGQVRRVWRNVKVPGHVDEVLQAVRDL